MRVRDQIIDLLVEKHGLDLFTANAEATRVLRDMQAEPAGAVKTYVIDNPRGITHVAIIIRKS